MPGPPGPTGPAGVPGTITPRETSVSILRPNTGDPIVAEALCLPGEQVIGGGARADATNPADTDAMHMQESGPSSSGWLARVSATSRFMQGSSLVLTVTVYCLGAP